MNARELSDSLHDAIAEAIAATSGSAMHGWEDEHFEGLARRVFAHQFSGCAPYRRFCEGRGITPETLPDYRAIPAVPTDVFKTVPLATFPEEEAELVFLTSGTTVGTRGRHMLRTSRTYEASLAPWLRRWLAPRNDEPLVLALIAPFADDPHSSLGHMVQWAVDHVGAPGSRHCWGPGGPDLDALGDAVRTSDRPILLLGTARALQHLQEERLAHEPMPLPPGSRVMETGGFKGAARTLERDVFYARLARGLELPTFAIISEYGMTELGSQGYQPGFRALSDRSTARRIGSSLLDWPDGSVDPDGVPRVLVFPPWCRVGATDPDTLELLPAGERGLLRFWDLSNVDSVLAVQTADMGVVLSQGVYLQGRAPGSTPRGCSLAVDEILAGA
ncbi:MAG: acyl-protein synthetase [Deltaproteobacteria bacterium]|nr:acyl-protein synthetase [Deltaproteobacteria bacterium]